MSKGHSSKARVYMAITSGGSAQSVPYSSKWMANFSAKRDDTTEFGAANNHYTQGLPDGTGSFEAFWDSATAQTYTAATDGTSRATYLYPAAPSTAGPYWYAMCFWDYSIEADVANAVKIKGTFAPEGDWTKVG